MAPASSLANYFKPVIHKRNGVALALWGPAGMGKSFQANKLLHSLNCKYLSLHSTTSFISIIQNLPIPDKLPLWARNNLRNLEKGNVLSEHLLDSLSKLLSMLAPFVLHLEDIHEAQNDQLELILTLAERVKRIKGVGFVVTSRTEPPAGFESIKLESLSRALSDELLERQVTAQLPPKALEWIYHKAAGNPLYTLEYLRFLSRQGFLWNDGKQWRWREPETTLIPITIEALIEFALSRVIHEDAKRVLQSRAFLPLNASEDLWKCVTGLSDNEWNLANYELQRQGIFENQTFSHPLYREVTLQQLSKAKRQQLARQALLALPDDPIQAALFITDANVSNEETVKCFQNAALKAKSFNQLEAGKLLVKALPYAQDEEKIGLAFEAAKLLRGRDDQEALRLAYIATENPSDETIYFLAELLASQHRLQEAESTLARLSNQHKQSSSWPLRLARIYASSLEFDKLLELVNEHPEIISNDPYVDYMICYAYQYTGNTNQAEILARKSLELTTLKPQERARFLGIFESLAIDQGHYNQAITFSDERIKLYRASQQILSLASALEKRAELLEHLADYSEQLVYLKEALQGFTEAGDYRRVTSSQAELAYALIQRGDYEQAQDILLEARETLTHLELSDSHLLVEAFLTLLYYEWRPPLASSLVQHHAQVLTKFEGEWLWPIMKAGVNWTASLAESWLGNPDYALQLAETGIKIASELRFNNIHAANLHARGLALEHLGQSQEAIQSLEQAVDMFKQAGFEGRAQRTALELDRLQKNLKNAKQRMGWFEVHGLLNGVNIARRYFPELATNTDQRIAKAVLPRLDVLGPMQITQDGIAKNVRGRKRQEFLALLLEARLAGRSQFRRLDLLDSLYPDSDEIKALTGLKQLVHALRLELGDNIIKTTASGYALGEINSDAELFMQHGDTSLWRGCYLENLDLLNSETVSESLYLTLFDKAKQTLELNPLEVARVAKFLLVADPYNSGYLALSLQALLKSNNYRSLNRMYDQAKIRFAEINETLPETWSGFLNNYI